LFSISHYFFQSLGTYSPSKGRQVPKTVDHVNKSSEQNNAQMMEEAFNNLSLTDKMALSIADSRSVPNDQKATLENAMKLMPPREVEKVNIEVKKIQSNFRAWLERKNYQNLKEAVVTLQSKWREKRSRSGLAGNIGNGGGVGGSGGGSNDSSDNTNSNNSNNNSINNSNRRPSGGNNKISSPSIGHIDPDDVNLLLSLSTPNSTASDYPPTQPHAKKGGGVGKHSTSSGSGRGGVPAGAKLASRSSTDSHSSISSSGGGGGGTLRGHGLIRFKSVDSRKIGAALMEQDDEEEKEERELNNMDEDNYEDVLPRGMSFGETFRQNSLTLDSEGKRKSNSIDRKNSGDENNKRNVVQHENDDDDHEGEDEEEGGSTSFLEDMKRQMRAALVIQRRYRTSSNRNIAGGGSNSPIPMNHHNSNHRSNNNNSHSATNNNNSAHPANMNNHRKTSYPSQYHPAQGGMMPPPPSQQQQQQQQFYSHHQQQHPQFPSTLMSMDSTISMDSHIDSNLINARMDSDTINAVFDFPLDHNK
jgi:hypothetical protein